MANGIPCTVFRRELEECIPELPEFLSKAGNQTHDVHSKETKVQLMLTMSQMLRSYKYVKENPTAAADTIPPAAQEDSGVSADA